MRRSLAPIRYIAIDEEEIQRVMHAMSHPIRRRILLCLDTHYGTDIGTLRRGIMKREKCLITRQAVHKHLMVLRKAKLITGGSVGDGAVYHLDPLPIRRTFRDLGRLLKRRFPAGACCYYRDVPWLPEEEEDDEDTEAVAEMDDHMTPEQIEEMLGELE